MFRKQKQLNKFVKPTDEQDKINKLKIEKELLERQNIEASKALDEKRKSYNLDYKSCKKIEDEHFNKIEKLQSEYLDLCKKVEAKNKEFDDINKTCDYLIESSTYLKDIIPTLEQIKVKLDKEIKDVTLKLNADKSFMEKHLSKALSEAEYKKKEFNKFSEELSKAKVEFNELIEKTHLENKILSIRKKDLEIYELRLRKQYPEAKIIL